MILLRILVDRKVRLEYRTSSARLRPTLDLIRLELDRFAPSKRIVVVADYGDISAILLRREPLHGRSPTLSHSA
jgi:hypothetical protein